MSVSIWQMRGTWRLGQKRLRAGTRRYPRQSMVNTQAGHGRTGMKICIGDNNVSKRSIDEISDILLRECDRKNAHDTSNIAVGGNLIETSAWLRGGAANMPRYAHVGY